MRPDSYLYELMDTFRDYAASLGPAPPPTYRILHERKPWMQVPCGHLQIRIAQFSPDNRANGGCGPGLHHWAIFIPTSTLRGVGIFYEVVGNLQTGYKARRVINARHPRWDRDERGSHLVGWVAPSYLGTLEAHLLHVPIQQGSTDWNCQTWVVEALKGLNQWQLFAVQMDHAQWSQQMAIVEQAWDVGDDD